MDILGTDRSFGTLSVRDLLEARDLYHWHLINRRNVVGTAVGLYRIRVGDPWPTQRRSALAERRSTTVKAPRTFDNSEVRDYSWPCVLVLVDRWVPVDRFGFLPSQLSPDDLVPKTLYLPDGRMVPVCVVEVQRSEVAAAPLPPRTWPAARIGGGFPLLTTVQGEEHLASVGGLVTDGHTTYALTSRHVAGPAGEPAATLLDGHAVRIGVSSGQHLTRRSFSQVYPDFATHRTVLSLDAGLIRLDDVSSWTSRVFGLPPIGELADLNEGNISLRLIDAHVRAFGAASGNLDGRIAALFYRHRSIGGYDQITDFLIAPAPGSAGARPGDSGTVWHLEQDQLRPIALQWGGQSFGPDASHGYNFTLAASLTAILRLLDVDLVTDHNTGAQPFWGKTGHYTIATLGCDHVSPPALKTLLAANVDRISFPTSDLDHTTIDHATTASKKAGSFTPLADVPDLIWKNLPATSTHGVPGGRDTAFRTGPEHPCHYADIDEPRPGDGATLRQLCLNDPGMLTVGAWQDYYHALGHDQPASRGLLPFRVWQFYDVMVDAAHGGDIPRYLAAAGLVAHYVGDACQPLHGSYLSDGLPDGTGTGVHSTYETVMVDRHDTDLLAGLPAALAATPAPSTVTDGHAAAQMVVELMDRTATALDPHTLVTTYAAAATKPHDSSPHVTDILWQQFGAATTRNIADGILTLAALWSSAWSQGSPQQADPDLSPVDLAVLQTLYEDPTFVPSLDLDHIQPQLADDLSEVDGVNQKNALTSI